MDKLTALNADDAALLAAAIEARKNAYAPYSKFKVGAAVRASDGVVYKGCNVENASYGLSCCAERNAVFTAVAGGSARLTTLCVAADTPRPVSPCGACRQVLAEFKIPRIILANLQGEAVLYTYEELLPDSFTL